MSRPSITTPPSAPSSRWRATINCRTGGCTDTRDAAAVTSASRMRCETSRPSSSTRLPSPRGSSWIDGVFRQLPQRLAVIQGDLLLHRLERQRAIHGATLEIDVAELPAPGGRRSCSCPIRPDRRWRSPACGSCSFLVVVLLGRDWLRRRPRALRGRRSHQRLAGPGGSGSKRGLGLNSRSAGGCGNSSDETCSITRPPTCTKLSSRAACSALMASRTRARPIKLEKNCSTSSCCAATTQSRYFETNAVSASATETCMPSLTASGDQRKSTSQNTPSSCL